LKAWFEPVVGPAAEHIEEIFWITDKETGNFYGTGFCTFVNAGDAAKALTLNGTELLGRPMKVELARPRPQTPVRGGGFGGGNRGGSAQKPRRPMKPEGPKPDGCDTIFVGNLSWDIDDGTMKNFLSDCGEIANLRWVEKEGTFTGAGFIQFADSSGVDKAIQKAGQNLMGRPIRMDYAETRGRRY